MIHKLSVMILPYLTSCITDPNFQTAQRNYQMFKPIFMLATIFTFRGRVGVLLWIKTPHPKQVDTKIQENSGLFFVKRNGKRGQTDRVPKRLTWGIKNNRENHKEVFLHLFYWFIQFPITAKYFMRERQLLKKFLTWSYVLFFWVLESIVNKT